MLDIYYHLKQVRANVQKLADKHSRTMYIYADSLYGFKKMQTSSQVISDHNWDLIDTIQPIK